MKPNKVSAVIIALNEEKNIERCLRSVSWAEERIVVDGESVDRTVETARRYADKVFSRKFTDFADQKNFALSKATCEWVFSIDADEEVTEGLKNEILALISGNAAADAYSVPRRSRIFGRWFRFSGTQDDRPRRLFRAQKARFEQPIHEIVKVDGAVGRIRHSLNHYTYEDVRSYLERLDRYTSREAEYLRSLGRRPGFLDYWVKPWLMFFKLFILRQGFRDGLEGFAFCCFSGFYVFLKNAKLDEMKKAVS